MSKVVKREMLRNTLDTLHAESKGLTASAIVSIDGLPIVSVLERNIDSSRVITKIGRASCRERV